MTIDTAIKDHLEIPQDQRKLTLKPPTPGVDLSKGQALQLVRTIANDLETHARSALDVAVNVTTFIDGNGAEAIDEGWRAYPFAYLGGVIGVEADYIRRLYRAGQSLARLHRKPIGSPPLNPHQLTPLYRMILEGRGDEIPKAWARADEIRSQDVMSWTGEKKNAPTKVNAKHVSAAVVEIIGPAKGRKQPATKPNGRRRGAAKAFVMPDDHIDNKFQDPDLERQQVIGRVIGHLAAAIDAVADRGDIPEIGLQKLREVKALFVALGDLKTADNLVPVH